MSAFDELIAGATDIVFAHLAGSIIRQVRGDRTNIQTVEAVVEIDSGPAGAPSTDGGLDQRSDKLQVTGGCLIEVAADQETHPEDKWEIGGDIWKAVGEPIGSDAGSKTIVCRLLERRRGRMPNTNTQV